MWFFISFNPLKGIHNIFIVVPQFLVAGFAAVLFAIVDPKKPLLPDHRAPIAPGPSLNGTIPIAAANAVVSRGKKILESMLVDNSTQGKDELLNNLPHFDSVVYIFWSAKKKFFFLFSLELGGDLLSFFFIALVVWLLVWHLF